ncbi:peptidoglycan DD-metalloendopeptidase family protein [Candidatus Uhrbacteria bacterium]|nr:peptidoglycan DD-metalloendopeptidase family protein [Candidatus Uhrbacteria bacterium]
MGIVFAQTSGASSEINALNDQISQKKKNIDNLNDRIDEYKKKIEKKQAEKTSLTVEVNLLDNRIAKTKLEIEETEQTIDLVNTEIALLNNQLTDLEKTLQKDRQLLASVLQKIQVKDQDLPLRVFFGSDSLSQLFDEVQSLETINKDLKQTLERTKQSKIAIESKRETEQTKRDQMQEMQLALEREKDQLEEEVDSQKILISETQNSENQFRLLLQQLKEEEQFITQQISVLQKEIEGKLSASENSGDSSLMSWPFNPLKGISVYFNDPTYPYRNLFEHSGIDLPAPKGTPIGSAAPGYVAWAKKGRLYGNYVMIIHSNGLSTLYAHLSRIDVKPDEFVARGQVIGAVGSTGLSTGPHLHFEVRKDGIPTDPIPYLK